MCCNIYWRSYYVWKVQSLLEKERVLNSPENMQFWQMAQPLDKLWNHILLTKNSPRNPDPNRPFPTHKHHRKITRQTLQPLSFFTTTVLRTRTKLFSNALYNSTKMPSTLNERIWVSTTLTRSPTTRTNSNKHKTTCSNRKQKKTGHIAGQHCMQIWRWRSACRTKSWLWNYVWKYKNNHAKNCEIMCENTKTITLQILYHLKLAPTHLLTPCQNLEEWTCYP